LSIRLTEEEEGRLDALAARTGRPKTFYVRQAIHAYLDELEELYQDHEAVGLWEATGKKSQPAEDLWKELGV
jgi:RHH-type rel operon transcriptional repressor/antitoxin RelB